MRLRCPRCQQKLSVPEKFAGRAIRCPACNRGFSVPKPKPAVDGPGTAQNLDLDDLAALESRSSEMDAEDLAAAESAVKELQAADTTGDDVRRCPNCNKQVPVEDPYAELLCSDCWTPIPPPDSAGATVRAQRLERFSRPRGSVGAEGFYGELASAVTYPASAINSLAAAAGVALLAGLAPVAVVVGGTYIMAQSDAGTAAGVQVGDLSGARTILTAVFIAEVLFFSAVALHTFLDVVRTTSIGNDRAPNLTWSPSQWGKSLLAYLILAAYLLTMTYLAALLTLEANPIRYFQEGDVMGLARAGGTPFFVCLLIVSFGVPMNLIGVSLESIVQGLHPKRVLKSIGRTHVHYVFLVLILVVYGLLFGAAFMAILFDWFLPQVEPMIAGSEEGNLTQVALSLLAWGLVMGFFFYGTYILARLHGLFARSFREKLEFGGS